MLSEIHPVMCHYCELLTAWVTNLEIRWNLLNEFELIATS